MISSQKVSWRASPLFPEKLNKFGPSFDIEDFIGKPKKKKEREKSEKKLVLFHSYPDDCVYVTFIDDRFFNFPHSSSHCDHSLAVYSCIKPE